MKNLSDLIMEKFFSPKKEKEKEKTSIRKMVALTLGKTSSEVTDDDFLKLQDYVLGEDCSCSELEKCLNLKRLSIEFLDDIMKLEPLKKLEKLELRYCDFENFSFLKSLPVLKSLYITGCNIDYYEDLITLNIDELFIDPAPPFCISDIPRPLSKLKVSQHGKMDSTSLVDLPYYWQYTYLDISSLSIEGTYSLYVCESLEQLTVKYLLANSDEFKMLISHPFSLPNLKLLRIYTSGNYDEFEELKNYFIKHRPNLEVQSVKQTGLTINMNF